MVTSTNATDRGTLNTASIQRSPAVLMATSSTTMATSDTAPTTILRYFRKASELNTAAAVPTRAMTA